MVPVSTDTWWIFSLVSITLLQEYTSLQHRKTCFKNHTKITQISKLIIFFLKHVFSRPIHSSISQWGNQRQSQSTMSIFLKFYFCLLLIFSHSELISFIFRFVVAWGKKNIITSFTDSLSLVSHLKKIIVSGHILFQFPVTQTFWLCLQQSLHL